MVLFFAGKPGAGGRKGPSVPRARFGPDIAVLLYHTTADPCAQKRPRFLWINNKSGRNKVDTPFRIELPPSPPAAAPPPASAQAPYLSQSDLREIRLLDHSARLLAANCAFASASSEQVPHRSRPVFYENRPLIRFTAPPLRKLHRLPALFACKRAHNAPTRQHKLRIVRGRFLRKTALSLAPLCFLFANCAFSSASSPLSGLRPLRKRFCNSRVRGMTPICDNGSNAHGLAAASETLLQFAVHGEYEEALLPPLHGPPPSEREAKKERGGCRALLPVRNNAFFPFNNASASFWGPVLFPYLAVTYSLFTASPLPASL